LGCDTPRVIGSTGAGQPSIAILGNNVYVAYALSGVFSATPENTDVTVLSSTNIGNDFTSQRVTNRLGNQESSFRPKIAAALQNNSQVLGLTYQASSGIYALVVDATILPLDPANWLSKITFVDGNPADISGPTIAAGPENSFVVSWASGNIYPNLVILICFSGICTTKATLLSAGSAQAAVNPHLVFDGFNTLMAVIASDNLASLGYPNIFSIRTIPPNVEFLKN